MASDQDKIDQMREQVGPAVQDATDTASAAVAAVPDQFRTMTKTIADRTRDQPLVALGVAAIIGFIVGRLVR